MSEFESLRTSFNAVADLYDEVRPGYQEVVIDDIILFAGLATASRILEIGCGTGQITLPFAVRGYQILALEPGNEMAALVTKKCAPYPNVRVSQMTFEEWSVAGQTFDLVLSAQAFHWIEPYSGCKKAATALRSGGTMALVWNNDVSQETPFYKATQPIYDRYMPREGSTDWTRVHIHDALRLTGAFNEIREIRHPWERTYSCSEYIKLLNTYSDHQRLPESSKLGFFQAIEDAIASIGGSVTRKYEAQIVLAHRI
jgi:SAM-dependent methyltransferase